MFIRYSGDKIQLNNVTTDDWITLRLKDVTKVTSADSRVIESAKEHCEEWFGKKLSDEFLENVYESALNGDDLNVTVAKNAQGQILTKFYNSKKEPVTDLSELSGPYDVILEIHGITFFRKSYSPVWRILQVRERPKPVPEIPDQYLFEDED